MPILCDLTEFVTHPIRTGIQRVTFEIVSRWTGSQDLIPVALFDGDHLCRLPETVFELMRSFFQENEEPRLDQIKAQIRALVSHPSSAPISKLTRFDGLFTPEVFFCPRRIAYYNRLAAAGDLPIFMTVYDFLLWTNPDYFDFNASLGTWPYLKLLRSIPYLAYISDYSRQVANDRVFRGHRSAGITIPLGADGLGQAPPLFDSTHQSFVVVSTIEPRKGHLQVLRAFEELWKQGHSIPLVFVGRKGWLNDIDLVRLDRLNSEEPLFSWHNNLRDPQVRNCIRESRATIYLSRHEGFGLPPVESLALGKPVIVTPHIPSIAMLPPYGQIRLDEVTTESIQSAVLSLADDHIAGEKTEEIRNLKLMTWDSVSQAYARWIDETLASRQSSKHAA